MSVTLEVRNLKKKFGELVAVDHVSFQVKTGETLGLLGPNGAGKTTTVSMVTGYLKPDEGEVLIEGKQIEGDRDPAKRKIGLVPQDLALYDELTAQQNLQFFGSLFELDGNLLQQRIHESLSLVGLEDRAKDKIKNYSGGMKRRINLAAALLHDPQLLLLDEPTVGVDPQSRNAIFDNLESLKRQGKTIVYTTHYMEEAERLCDRIVIIDHGRVIADDNLQGLNRKTPAANRLLIETEKPLGDVELLQLRKIAGVVGATVENGKLRVELKNLSSDSPRLLQWLADNGHSYHHVVSERPNLESVFLSLTGRSLRDE